MISSACTRHASTRATEAARMVLPKHHARHQVGVGLLSDNQPASHAVGVLLACIACEDPHHKACAAPYVGSFTEGL